MDHRLDSRDLSAEAPSAGSCGGYRITGTAQKWRTDVQGAVEASLVLKDLLLTNAKYRRNWQRFAKRESRSELTQAAVAQVIALYLWEAGVREETETDLPRALRDRVRRALAGKLTAETLTWFVDAFDMSTEDEERLWRAAAGGGRDEGGIVDTLVKRRALARPQLHRTVSLFERYDFDSAGVLIRRHTMHVIRAVLDEVSSYLFTHEPNAQRIEVLAGGELGQEYRHGDGLVSQEIILNHRLALHKTISMEYETYYSSNWRPVELRRTIRGRCENVDMAMHFATDSCPSAIWFCAWRDDYEGDPVLQEEIKADDRGHAHRFVAFAEQTVLGFKWSWAEPPAG